MSALALVVVGLATAGAADDGPGRYRVQWRRSASGAWTVRAALRADPQLALPPDPSCGATSDGGARLTISTSVGEARTFTLPCDGWVTKGDGHRYRASSPADAVRRARLDPWRLSIRLRDHAGAEAPVGPLSWAQVRLDVGDLHACWRFEGFARNQAMRVLTNGPALPCAVVCGDGFRDGGEACDDGNAEAGDGCRQDCTLERCGDGLRDAGEACDDGNTADGDCCSGDCAHRCVGDVNGDAIVRIACVGDSNTGGLAWLAISWCWQLQDLVPAGWVTQNFGVLGMTAHAAGGILDDALAAEPDVVVIALGTNDIGRYEPEETAEAILILHERSRATCYDPGDPRSCVQVAVMGIPPVFPGPQRSADEAATFNEEVVIVNAILQIAARAAYVDSYTGLGPEHFLSDGYHVNTAGQAIRAARVWGWLSSVPDG